MKVNRKLSFALTLMLVIYSLCGNLVYATPTSGIEIVLDKTIASVGEIVTASINVNNINNFSGYHINMKYDPKVLQPITSEGAPYTELTRPEAGTILNNSDFGINSIAANKVEEGILNFSRAYLNLETYREEANPENTGTVAVVKFKVIKEEVTSIKFEDSSTLPNAINGTYLFDWDGNRIVSGYSVGQAQTINFNKEDSSYITIDFDKNIAEVGEIITATLKVNKIDNFSGYQVNLKYDPSVLQAVNPITGAAYKNSTIPSKGELLILEDYGPIVNAANNVTNGTLNFSRSYTNLEAYREANEPENSGTLAVIGFKVLQQKNTSVLFENTNTMPNAITGTTLFDWFGNKANQEYMVIQPKEINMITSATPTASVTIVPTVTPIVTATPKPTEIPTEDSYITMTFDKNAAEVGEVITATLRVNKISELAGYQVNIKYDPTILQAVNTKTGKVYMNSSIPTSGELLVSEDYGPLPAAASNIEAGILNFTRSYMNLEAYREGGVAEETGTLAIVGFKVLQQKETEVMFVKSNTMPNAITGTILINWFGEKITSGYSVIQPENINGKPIATPTAVATATPEVTPIVTATPVVTPTITATPVVTQKPTATPVVTPTVTATPTPTVTSTPIGDSFITIDFDKTNVFVGDVIKASVRVNDISNLSGYQVNIKYDSTVLKAVDPITRTAYTNSTLPLDGELLINNDYSIYVNADSKISEGILNFSKGYANFNDYKLSNDPEETGTILVVGFEVLQAKNTFVKFETTSAMPNGNEGTLLFDWDGDRITSGYSVVQPQEITVSEKPAPKFIYGDVDGNGSVRINDAVLIRDYVLGKINEFPYEYGMLAADVDGNGSIRINDAVLVRDYVLGKIFLFPVEEDE